MTFKSVLIGCAAACSETTASTVTSVRWRLWRQRVHHHLLRAQAARGARPGRMMRLKPIEAGERMEIHALEISRVIEFEEVAGRLHVQ